MQTSPPPNPKHDDLTLAVIPSLIVLGLAGQYLVWRIGFATPWLPITGVLGLSLIILCLPVLIRLRWKVPWALILVGSLLGVSTIGLVFANFKWLPPAALTAGLLGGVGLALFAALFRRWLVIASWAGLILVLGSLIFSLWLGGSLWGNDLQSPLFPEALLTEEAFSPEFLFDVAIAHQWQTHLTTTLNINGLVAARIPPAFHMLMAGVASALGQGVSQVYILTDALLFLPLLLSAFFATAWELRQAWYAPQQPTPLWRAWAFWGVIFIGQVWLSHLFFLTFAVNQPGYRLALLGGMALIGMLFTPGRLQTPTALIGLIAIASAHLPSAWLGLAVAGLFVFTTRRRVNWLAWGIAGVGVAICTLFWLPTGSQLAFFPLGLFEQRILMREAEPFYLFIAFSWPLLLTVLRLHALSLTTFEAVKTHVRTGQLKDLQVAASLCLLAGVAALIVLTPGTALFYWLDLARWWALLCLPAAMAWLGERLSMRWQAAWQWRGWDTPLHVSVFYGVNLLLLISLIMSTALPVRAALMSNLFQRGLTEPYTVLLPPLAAVAIQERRLLELIPIQPETFWADVRAGQARLADRPAADLLNRLLALREQPLTERANTHLDLSTLPTNALPGAACNSTPLAISALTGQPSSSPMPPTDCDMPYPAISYPAGQPACSVVQSNQAVVQLSAAGELRSVTCP